jgi:hypothetical protein
MLFPELIEGIKAFIDKGSREEFHIALDGFLCVDRSRLASESSSSTRSQRNGSIVVRLANNRRIRLCTDYLYCCQTKLSDGQTKLKLSDPSDNFV